MAGVNAAVNVVVDPASTIVEAGLTVSVAEGGGVGLEVVPQLASARTKHGSASAIRLSRIIRLRHTFLPGKHWASNFGFSPCVSETADRRLWTALRGLSLMP
jgi:hypothetical protein